MKDYRGKIVFLEKKDSNAKSQYGSGEFIVIEQSPHNLHVIKMVVGYGAHCPEQRSLVGADAWHVISEIDSPPTIKQFTKELRHWSETTKRGESRQWVESVYAEAGNVASRLERMLGCACDEPQKLSVYEGKTHSFLLNGHRVSVTIE